MIRGRALLSVSDKTGIAAFGGALAKRGWEVLSTGGTARALEEAGVRVTEVARTTGHSEMMDGRVKTLHPAIHAGILARRDHPGDMEELARRGYGPIDLVAVNLYPFPHGEPWLGKAGGGRVDTVATSGATPELAMADVDIGGPTLLRAAAKNHFWVWVVVDPGDYDDVLHVLSTGINEETRALFRRRLAAKAFRKVSCYDRAVATYLAGTNQSGEAAAEPGRAPAGGESLLAVGERTAAWIVDGNTTAEAVLRFPRRRRLRYGENPGQSAVFCTPAGKRQGVAALVQHHGRELSYNNILDLDGALLTLAPFAFVPEAAACLVKHTTPCGLAVRPSLPAAFERARDTDPASAFGSVVAVNRPVCRGTAAKIGSMFVECVAAPGFSAGAREILTRKKHLRLLTFPADEETHPREHKGTDWWHGAGDVARAGARFLAAYTALPEGVALRSVYGGVLAQALPAPGFFGLDDPTWEVVTERRPTVQEWNDLSFAWAAVAGVKSNAIVLAKESATVGIGTGQTSRVDSAKIAIRKAREAGLAGTLKGASLASDAFFPFRDGVEVVARAGVRAIVQPGGSVRDREVVAAAEGHGIAMVFTGTRCFRH